MSTGTEPGAIMDTYRMCISCVMDTTDPDIRFDERGICHYCREYPKQREREVHRDEKGQKALEALILRIRHEGRNRDYDCVIGLSGGADSTYAAYLAKTRYGLRPLVVHLDNGWNSEAAVRNIKNATRTLGVDLHTYVIDWEEFKDLQIAFLRSSISNAEIPTDHAIRAILYRTAADQGIRYIITGSNFDTEAFMPWMYDAMDLRLIKAIHRRYGSKPLRTFPTFGMMTYVSYVYLKGIQMVPLLNFVPYRKEEAKEILRVELGWQDYGGKHGESIYTRFFQSHILPTKYNIDKRKAHLSCLILAGQMTRDQALQELQKPLYSPQGLGAEIDYFRKKLGLSLDAYNDIMKAQPREYSEFPNQCALRRLFGFAMRYARERILLTR